MSCITCSSNNIKKIADNKYFIADIVQCQDCLTVQPDPVPMEDEVQRFYASGYYSYNAIQRWFKIRIGDIFAKSRFDMICKHVNMGNVDSVLEVGCGYGNLLKELSWVTRERIGVEPSVDGIAHILSQMAKKKMNFGIMNDIRYLANGNKFDLIILSHVLEHATDPRQMLDRLKKLLAPNGKMYIECPNRLYKTYKNSNYQCLADFYFWDLQSFEMFLKSNGLKGEFFNIDFRYFGSLQGQAWNALNYPLWEIDYLLDKPMMFKGKSDSLAICGVVEVE